jgi:hypothetical protein
MEGGQMKYPKRIYLVPDGDNHTGLSERWYYGKSAISVSYTRTDATRERQTCEWTEDIDGIYESNCGTLFEVNNGTPKDNGMVFCHHCGRKIREVKA